MYPEKKSFPKDIVKEKLAHYCQYQERCHYEVEQKLWEFILNPEEKEEIILFLLENNFLSEERFVKKYVHGKFYIKKWGKNKIKQALKQKKIGDRLITTGLQEIDKDDYIEVMTTLLDKKSVEVIEANHWKKKKKLYDYMMSKGFESNLVMELLDTK